MTQVIGTLLDLSIWFYFVLITLILFVLMFKLNRKGFKYYVAGYFIMLFFMWCGDSFFFNYKINVIYDDELSKKEPKCFVDIYQKWAYEAIDNTTMGSTFMANKRTGKIYRDYILAKVKKRYRAVYGEKEFKKCANQKPQPQKSNKKSKTKKG